MKNLILYFAVVILSGCTDGMVKLPIDGADKLQNGYKIIQVSPENIKSYASIKSPSVVTTLPTDLENPEIWEYKIGIGDKISITVFGHAELNGAKNTGVYFLIDSMGGFEYPYIGRVSALGRNTESIRSELVLRMTEFISSPQITLAITGYNSQKVVSAGELKAPQSIKITSTAIRVSDLLTLSGGATKLSDLSKISITRNGKTYNVNYENFFISGNKLDNPTLISNDVVNVPVLAKREAYIMGEVIRNGVIDLTFKNSSVANALALSGGLDRVRHDSRGIFIFRGKNKFVNVYQIDTSNPVGLNLSSKFQLEPKDVIYVTRSPLQRWEDTINRIIPSLGAVSQTNSSF